MPAAKPEKFIYLVYVSPSILRLPAMVHLLPEMRALVQQVPDGEDERKRLIQSLENLGWVQTWPKEVDLTPTFGPILVFENPKVKTTLQVPWHTVLGIFTLSDESARTIMGFSPLPG